MLFVHFDLKKKMFLIVNFIDLANFKKHHSSFFLSTANSYCILALFNMVTRNTTAGTNLRCHHSLALGDEVASRTRTILELAMAFVPLEPANHAVVPAASTLGLPRALLRGGVAEGTATAAATVHALQRCGEDDHRDQ